MSTIALLSDFGTRDWYVAEIKGVILSMVPEASIVDITHDITPGDIRSAAFIIYTCSQHFPLDTIFCIAIDPRPSNTCPVIAAKVKKQTFVCPDNGVLSYLLEQCENAVIHTCSHHEFFPSRGSFTFRGRDIIAPVSAHLSRGVNIADLGPASTTPYRFSFPSANIEHDRITSEIVYIDRFGNLITGIKNETIADHSIHNCTLDLARHSLTVPLKQHYDEVEHGKFLIYAGSSGFLEIAANGEHAATSLNTSTGDTITVTFGNR
jgi:S-adenosylmethionine hydrolase